jgi:hypothetical protein
MVRTKGKRSASDAGVAPASNENDAYLIQRTCEVDLSDCNMRECSYDRYGTAGQYCAIGDLGAHFDGRSLVKDQTGNVPVFKSVEAANLRAAKEWEAMQVDTLNEATPALEGEQTFATTSIKQKVAADGRMTYSGKQIFYLAGDEFDEDEIDEELDHRVIANVKVEVLKATIVP